MATGKYRTACLKVKAVREWLPEQQGKHFCQCGCGEVLVINPEHYYKGLPKFLRGHDKRSSPNEVIKKFWQQVNKTEKCWEWTGFRNKDGYGVTSVNGKLTRAHRLSWKLRFGDIPEGSQILHRCDNPACVRPGHLFLGDYNVNHRDKTFKGRAAKKLLPKHVLSIIRLVEVLSFSRAAVAKLFHIGTASVTRILTGEDWAHLTGRKPKGDPRWARKFDE